MTHPQSEDDLKREAAVLGVRSVADGMIVGLGTGSTSAWAVRILGERVTDLEDRLEMQTFQSVTARLAATLLRLAGETDEVKGASHQQIAETIGASRETVTRALGDFKSQGLVEIGRGRVQLKDKAGLEELIDAE